MLTVRLVAKNRLLVIQFGGSQSYKFWTLWGVSVPNSTLFKGQQFKLKERLTTEEQNSKLRLNQVKSPRLKHKEKKKRNYKA